MHLFAVRLRPIAALCLALPLLSAAQTPPAADLERVRREAEKVFSWIKFHTVPTKPATETRAKPQRAPAASKDAAAKPSAPAADVTPAEAAPPSLPAMAEVQATPSVPAGPERGAEPAPAAPAPESTVPTPAATEAEAERDEPEDPALQLRSFVAPVLPPAVQSTLGVGTRAVKVRFTVEADGRVSHAEAAPDLPRRLAKPATEAILQWQFAPLPQARTAEVEIGFRRD